MGMPSVHQTPDVEPQGEAIVVDDWWRGADEANFRLAQASQAGFGKDPLTTPSRHSVRASECLHAL